MATTARSRGGQVVGDVDDAARHRQRRQMGTALRVGGGVGEAHRLQVAPVQELADDRRLDAGDLEHDVDFAGIERLQHVRAADRQKFRPASLDAAVLQQLQRERARAAAFGADGQPASCEPRQRVDLRLIRAQEHPHRLVIERAERNDGRFAIDVGQRLGDAPLHERDVDPAIAKQREILGGALRLPELEVHTELLEMFLVLLAVFLVRAARGARRHDEAVRRGRLYVPRRDIERERDQRDHRNHHDKHVARPPVPERPPILIGGPAARVTLRSRRAGSGSCPTSRRARA